MNSVKSQQREAADALEALTVEERDGVSAGGGRIEELFGTDALGLGGASGGRSGKKKGKKGKGKKKKKKGKKR